MSGIDSDQIVKAVPNLSCPFKEMSDETPNSVPRSADAPSPRRVPRRVILGSLLMIVALAA